MTLSPALRSAISHYVTPNLSITLHSGVSFADGQLAIARLSLVTAPELGSARSIAGECAEMLTNVFEKADTDHVCRW